MISVGTLSRRSATLRSSPSSTPKLPELSYRELVNLLCYFGADLRGEGSPQLKVTNRSGKMVMRHCHPSKAFWPEAVAATIRDLEITRDEFFEWDRRGRKRR